MGMLIPIQNATERGEHGGKSANLAFLARLGINVPDGGVVPATEFTRQVAACAGGADVAREIVTRPLRDDLVRELRALVDELGGRVSVRSSATLEDAKTHSFAGQFSTVLNVGIDGIEDAVRVVWASSFSDNVRAYLRRADLDPAKLRMAVVVQRQVDSEVSGVAMGRVGGILVEAVFGQGEGLVSGAIAADRWEVEKGRVIETRIAQKSSRMAVPRGAPTGALDRVELVGEERGRASLHEAQVVEVAEVCARIAEACGGNPQDCEFAYAGGKLHLLQTRDVTASLPVSAPPLAAFAPPGKGAWELDANHFQRPCTAMFRALFPLHMAKGFRSATERYGALISHVDFAFVNGFPYTRVRPVAAPEDASAKAPPPAWLFKLLCAVLPPLRRRIRAAERIWQTREWRVQLEEWRHAKARAVTVHLRLQGVDREALDDTALAEHFEEVLQHAGNMIEQHHSYNLATMLPAGDLLVFVAKASKGRVADAEVCAALAGASPMTADLASDEAREVGALLSAQPEASALLQLDLADAAESRTISDRTALRALERLRALPGEAGERTRAFLAMREFRLVEGFDPAAPCLRECPSLLWQALRRAALLARTPPSRDDHAASEAALSRLRAAVAEEARPELDTRIEEARALASLRDERALFSDVWALGILRTVVLEMGRRIVQRSPTLLANPSDLVQASPDEALSLFLRSEGPSAVELASRASHVRAYTMKDAPNTLGPKACPPPSPDILPAGAARVMAAMLRVMTHILAPPPEKAQDGAMRGNAASSGVWEGPVHVVSSHDDAKDIPAGAVLVVGSGSSTFTMLAPLASAVVAEGGGLLSHVAIVCREYRIPCVCGVAGVLGSLRSGQRVRVDGTRGLVEVLAA